MSLSLRCADSRILGSVVAVFDEREPNFQQGAIECVYGSTAFVLRRLTHAACVGSFSVVIDPPNANKPLVVEAAPLLVNREDAARLLCVSTRELDRLRASGRIVARRHGRRILISIDELRRFAGSLPADEPGG
jgi:hypothetical protein